MQARRSFLARRFASQHLYQARLTRCSSAVSYCNSNFASDRERSATNLLFIMNSACGATLVWARISVLVVPSPKSNSVNSVARLERRNGR